MANGLTWRNRIVGYADVEPSQLLANPLNFRRHPKNQQDALSGIVAEIGYLDPVLVQHGTDTVIDGHLRVELAMRSGQPTIPVQYVDLSDEEAALALASFDPISAMAFHDQEQLNALLAMVETDNADVQALLDSLAGDVEIVEGLTDPDSVPGVPDEPITKPGDIWLLGRHRLLCGDATVVTDVSRIMDIDLADMVWTDPPYGVAIGDKNRWLNSVGRSNRIEKNLDNDTLGEGDLLVMLRDAFSNAATVCTAGAAWYVAAPAGPLHLLFGQALNELGILRQMLIWVKDNSTFSPLGVTYHWQHEPIFYGWMPGGSHSDFTDRKQTTVWNVDRPSKSPDHPTMKPVELVTRSLEHSTKPGAVVLDMFGGSGTTLIACEQLNREARLIELDPHYCDVIVKRYELFTGKTATLAHDRAMAAS